MFGVFRHTLREPYVPIFRGFDDEFYVPHSRHTEIRRDDVMKVPELTRCPRAKSLACTWRWRAEDASSSSPDIQNIRLTR